MCIWKLIPEYLPDSLLYREHQFVHGLLKALVIGKPKRGVTRYLKYGGFVCWRHYLLANEMRSRGADHKSPIHDFWHMIPPSRRQFNYPGLTPENILRDKAVIVAKMRASAGHDSQFRSTLPPHLAGFEMRTKLDQVIAAGTLPPYALIL
jgi:hypothetical protein